MVESAFNEPGWPYLFSGGTISGGEVRGRDRNVRRELGLFYDPRMTDSGTGLGLLKKLAKSTTGMTTDHETDIVWLPDYRRAKERQSRQQNGRELPGQSTPFTDALHLVRGLTGLRMERIAKLIGVSRQALHKWECGGRISDANRQRLLTIAEIIRRAAKNHGTPAEMQAWLDTPRGPDGKTPAQLLEAGEFDRARLLAVAVPSPGIKRPPEWVGKPVPERFRAGAERWDRPLPPDHDDEYFAHYGNPGESVNEEDETR